MIKLSREFGTRVHIVHHSSADSLPMLREAKAAGLKITAETCPHYLTFAAEEIPDGATEFKCCPPIRERENREQLWSALGDGTIDMIVSDHSPCPPEMKLRESGDFLQAWGGISSLQLRLPIVWTESKRRGFSIQDLARWLCSAPAKLVGLEGRKGLIADRLRCRPGHLESGETISGRGPGAASSPQADALRGPDFGWRGRENFSSRPEDI